MNKRHFPGELHLIRDPARNQLPEGAADRAEGIHQGRGGTHFYSFHDTSIRW